MIEVDKSEEAYIANRIPELIEYAQNRSWDELIHRCNKFKCKNDIEENNKHNFKCFALCVNEISKHNQTQTEVVKALFEACMHDPPLKAIKSLIEICPDRESAITSQTNATRSTIAHVACYVGVKAEIIRYLVSTNPSVVLKKDAIGWTPLHILCWKMEENKNCFKSNRLKMYQWKDSKEKLALMKTLLLLDAKHDVDLVEQETWQTQEARNPFFSALNVGITNILAPRMSPKRAAAAIASQDRIGWTPLHFACWSCSEVSGDMVDLLLKQNPGAASIPTRDGWTPLHLACRRHHKHQLRIVKSLLRVAPECISMQGKSGLYPLHLSCWWQLRSDVVRVLLEARPDVSTLRSIDGYRPIDILWRQYKACNTRSLNEILKQDKVENDSPHQKRTNEEIKCINADVESLLNDTRHSKDVAIGDVLDDDDFFEKIALLLHAERTNQVTPFSLLDVSRSSPIALLHAAVAIQDLKKNDDYPNGYPDDIQTLISKKIKRINETDAELPLGGTGKTLLCKGIEVGLSWRSHDCFLINVVTVYPEALQIKNPSSKLYPFMDAAALESTSSKENLPSMEKSNIDTIYSLLRSAPHVVNHM